jgi:YidC/Oxa1 family membrane protein insertase
MGEGECVRFWIDVREGGDPVVRVIRWYRLPRQPEKLHRHDLESEIVVENLSETPRRVFVAYRGGLGLRHSNPRFPDQFIDWGVHEGGRVVGHRKTFTDVSKNGDHRIELYEPALAAPGVGLSWAATGNTYFTCTIAPLDRKGGDNADYLAQVTAIDVDGSALTKEDVTLRFLTVGEKLAAAESLHYPAAVYLGEKEIDGFRVVDSYKQRNYYYQIAQGFGICTFNWLVELMIWLLNSLFNVVRDFGVAIIILVLIVRTLLHPITKKGQVNMVRMQHRMQELAPKIEEIKKKYSNDKARMNEEMMKLNINPAGQMITCLPMVIQMPIWVALYISLSNNILMRHEGFLFTWIGDLTAQDALYTFSSPLHVPLFGWELTSFNLLPILVAIFMYTQQKLQPKPKPNPNMTDQQRQQQEMMQKMGPIMSIMMLVIFYNMPSGLNLYIMSSSLFGTIEQHRIRKHIREREEAGTLHKPDKPKIPPDAMKRKPGKPSFIARLQKAAEDAQRNKFGDSRKPKKRR